MDLAKWLWVVAFVCLGYLAVHLMKPFSCTGVQQARGGTPTVMKSGVSLLHPGSSGNVEDAIHLCVESLTRPFAAAVTSRNRQAAQPSPDAEWLSFPRHVSGIVAGLRDLRWDPMPAKFFRCVELNPRDTYIPPAVRAELEVMLEAVPTALAQLRAARNAAQSAACDRALESGEMRPVNVPIVAVRAPAGHPAGEGVMLDTIDSGKLLEAGVDMCQVVDGKLLGASFSSSQEGQRFRGIYQFVAAEIGFGVIAWFERVGALEPHEAEAHRGVILSDGK